MREGYFVGENQPKAIRDRCLPFCWIILRATPNSRTRHAVNPSMEARVPRPCGTRPRAKALVLPHR
jgi:hypothetical protein